MRALSAGALSLKSTAKFNDLLSVPPPGVGAVQVQEGILRYGLADFPGACIKREELLATTTALLEQRLVAVVHISQSFLVDPAPLPGICHPTSY